MHQPVRREELTPRRAAVGPSTQVIGNRNAVGRVRVMWWLTAAGGLQRALGIMRDRRGKSGTIPGVHWAALCAHRAADKRRHALDLFFRR
jgi:hypothetical protein